MIDRIDIEKARLEKDRKETLQDIISAFAILIVVAILGSVIIYQAIKINNLKEENYKLYVEVQSLKEVIE